MAAVAARVLAGAGIGGSTIRDVADAGGWSTTMVTHYFASKDELLQHTLAMSVRESGRAVELAMSAGLDELRAIVEQTLPLDDESTARWRLWIAFWGSALGSEDLADIQRMRQERLVDLLAGALQRRAADRNDDDLDFEARRLVALLDGVSVQAVFAPDLWPVDRQLAQFAAVLGA